MSKNTPVDEDVVARFMHDTYERLAPAYGYETRLNTREFSPDSPNGKLMVAVCKELIQLIRGDNSELVAEIEDAIDVIVAESYVIPELERVKGTLEKCHDKIKALGVGTDA